ncbi:DapH/DapD/GlmU-related protein [Vibrio cyclitrophicus]
MHMKKSKFLYCGKGVVFDPLSSYFSYQTISVGDGSYIGPKASFSSTHSKIKIGRNVMFGPSVHIFGGNHIVDQVGIQMSSIMKKEGDIDPDVVVCDEAWVGGGAIILTGVTIGRGAIIGAGSVVTKSVKPYSVSGGNPCRFIKMRFTESEIKEHEKALYRK